MNKYNWSDKEQFLRDWSEAKNKCDFLLRHNLTATSGNYHTLNKWLNFHLENVNSDSFLSYEQIFVTNSLCSRRDVKNIILKDNLLPYKCAECNNEGIWNGKPLTLQLEHINGINNDNRLENLAYLCPNCHTQTTSYAGRNRHSKVFMARLSSLQNLKCINSENILELSDLWNTRLPRVKTWLNDYKDKLIDYDIYIDQSILTQTKKKSKDKVLGIKVLHIMKESRLQDVEKYKNEKNAVQLLSVKWNISRHSAKVWIKNNAVDFYNKNDAIKIEPVKEVNIESRFSQAALLTNKKQVLSLSKEWNTSVNGAKKWIRNNMPEKFKQIYDDNLLERNKKLAQKDEKKLYLQSLDLNTFNLVDVMKYLNINKPSLYALIKQHNPNLYEQLMSKVSCKYCGNKTRTSGTNKKGEVRYRCLSKECNKSVYIRE